PAPPLPARGTALPPRIFFVIPPPPRPTLFPYTTLFRFTKSLPISHKLASAFALVILIAAAIMTFVYATSAEVGSLTEANGRIDRSEEHTSELQSRRGLVCRLLLEKKKHLPRVEGLRRVR